LNNLVRLRAPARAVAEERITRRGFYIPSGAALTREQAGQVAAALRRLVE
jgi:hypothetical protein